MRKALPSVIFITFAVFVLLRVLDGPAVWIKDGTHYAVYLRLFFHDQSLSIDSNSFSVGPAVLWSPFWLVTDWYLTVTGRQQVWSASYGWSEVHARACQIGTSAWFTSGLWLLWLLLKRHWGERFAGWIGLGVIATMFLGTSLLVYTVLEPTMSHALAAAACCWFLASLLLLDAQGKGVWLIRGVALGVLMLVRWQAVIIGLLMLPFLLQEWKRSPIVALQGVVHAASGATFAFSPQIIVWWVMTGEFLTMPQGGGFLQWTRPALVGTLFSSRVGLMTLSPVVAIGVAGIIFGLVRGKSPDTASGESRNHLPQGFWLSIFAIVLLQTYLNSVVLDWWAGEAFAGRRFVVIMPLVALGLAEIVRWSLAQNGLIKAGLAGLLMVCVAWNEGLSHQYLHNHLSRLPKRSFLMIALSQPKHIGRLFLEIATPWDKPRWSRGQDLFADGWTAEFPLRDEQVRAATEHRVSVNFPAGSEPPPSIFAATPPSYQRLQQTFSINGIRHNLTPHWQEIPLPRRRRLTINHDHRFDSEELSRPSTWIGSTGVAAPTPISVIHTSQRLGLHSTIAVGNKNVSPKGIGLNVAVICPETALVLSTATFDLYRQPDLQDDAARWLNAVPRGLIIAVAAKDTGVHMDSTPSILLNDFLTAELMYERAGNAGWESPIKAVGFYHQDATGKSTASPSFDLFGREGDLEAGREYLSRLPAHQQVVAHFIISRPIMESFSPDFEAALHRCGIRPDFPLFAAIGVTGSAPNTAMQPALPSEKVGLHVGQFGEKRTFAAVYKTE